MIHSSINIFYSYFVYSVSFISLFKISSFILLSLVVFGLLINLIFIKINSSNLYVESFHPSLSYKVFFLLYLVVIVFELFKLIFSSSINSSIVLFFLLVISLLIRIEKKYFTLFNFCGVFIIVLSSLIYLIFFKEDSKSVHVSRIFPGYFRFKSFFPSPQLFSMFGGFLILWSWILMDKLKYISIVGITAGLLAIILSETRAIIVSLIFCFICYNIHNYLKKISILKIKRLSSIAVIFILSTLICLSFFNQSISLELERSSGISNVLGISSGRVEIWTGNNIIVPLGENHNHNIILDIIKDWYKNPAIAFLYLFSLFIIYRAVLNYFDDYLLIILFINSVSFLDLFWYFTRASYPTVILIASFSIIMNNKNR